MLSKYLLKFEFYRINNKVLKSSIFDLFASDIHRHGAENISKFANESF